MDLAEKRRQLDEIRAAREAKQRSVQQQLQQQQKKGSQHHVSSSSLARSGTPQSSMASSVGGDPLNRVASTLSAVSLRDEQQTGDPRTTSAAASRRPPVTLSTRISSGDLRSKVNRRGTGSGTTEAVGGEGSAWKVEVGIGAFALKPTVEEGENDHSVQDGTMTASVVGVLSAVEVEDASACATERTQDCEASGQQRVVPPPDVAMLLAHSLRAESFCNCKDRCVLDVVMLDPKISGGNTGVSDGYSGFLVAFALSEPHQADEQSDSAPKLHSGRGIDAQSLLPLPLSTSTATTTAAVAEVVGELRGLVLLWCISRGKTGDASYSVIPLCFDSEIRVLTYTRHRQHLLFGGAANGCVVGWRIDHALQGHSCAVIANGLERFSVAPSLMPLPAGSIAAVAPSERSFPSPHTHQSRVIGMAVHGDVNYHHLYTISQDGRVCMWAPLQLGLPTSSRDGMVLGQPIGCIGSCAAFVDKAADAMSKVVVGCLDGRVLEGRTKSSSLVEMSPINAMPAFSITNDVLPRSNSTPRTSVDGPAHHATVVAVAPHPLHADPRISDTVLTAAADGSCSLWLGSRRIAIDGFTSQVNCLRWSPTHPAVFVAGESNGRVAAWDLSRNSFSPVAVVYLRSVPSAAGWASTPSATSAVNAGSYRSAAVTNLAFSDDGAWLSCGTATGEIHLLHLRSDLTVESAATTAAKEVKACPLSCARNEEVAFKDGSDDATVTAAAVGRHATSSWIDARFGF
ncbi:hypothetical protein TcYC6_0018420 [Trypanosoma cruzi]|nr:hypothetical protein TcYC6_0018420 [Trypanosoma cruzi]